MNPGLRCISQRSVREQAVGRTPRLLRGLLPIVLLAGGGAVRATAVGSLEERVAALEGQVVQLSTENLALRAKLAGVGENPAAAWVRPEGRAAGITLGGLMQVQAESKGAPDVRYAGLNERVLLRRMRVAVAGRFAENMAFKFETEFGNASIAGRSGASGQITDACITWSRYPAFNVRAGQFKTPFGFEQLISDPKTTFIERTLSNDRLTVGRQIGAQASGEIAKSVLCYSAGVFNGCGTNNGGNDNSRFMTAGRLVATMYSGVVGTQPFRWTTAANAFDTFDQGGFTGRRTGFGADTQVGWGRAHLGGEWLRNDNRPSIGAPVAAEGWSLFGAWRVNRWWQGVLRYEACDSSLALTNTTTREWTVGFNYFLKGDDLKLMFNYQLGRPPAPAAREGRWLGRMQVVF